MSSDLFEVIFVDDGSTDGSGQWLDRAAERHPGLVRVIHQENSGWAGRPRNVGADAAAGTYVFFVDADDWLLPAALESMYAAGERDGSDIVIGRLVGNHRGVPTALFDEGDRCTNARETHGLFSSLTTHKLYRREFLRQHGLRFPEGRVRLEDQMFVMRAYLLADRVSIVGSRPCYVLDHRVDDTNLTAQSVDLPQYLESIRTLAGIIVQGTQPGPQRQAALARPLGTELLNRIRGRAYVSCDEAERESMFDAVREVVVTEFADRPEHALSPQTRIAVELIRADDRQGYENWMEWDRRVSSDVVLTGLSWVDGTLSLEVRGCLTRDGAPLVISTEGDRLRLVGPDGGQLPEGPVAAAADVTHMVDHASMLLVLKARDTMEEWRVPAATCEARLEEAASDARTLHWVATASLDPATVASGTPLRPGLWDVYVRVRVCGWQVERRLGSSREEGIDVLRPALLDGTVIVPFWTPGYGNLSVDVDQWTKSLAESVSQLGAEAVELADGTQLRLDLPMVVRGRGAPLEVHFKPEPSSGRRPEVRSGVAKQSDDGRAALQLPLADLPREGRWSLHLRAGGPGSGPPHSLGLTYVPGAAPRLVPGGGSQQRRS